jgi:hypothetical protein
MVNVISKGVRYKGEDVPEGQEIKDIETELAQRWFNAGLASPKEEKDSKKDNQKNQQERDESQDGEQKKYPYHKGGGYYELSNGTTVRGEEEAIKAQEELESE